MRFPSCPQIPVVIECVITEDSWSADDSQRHTTRRCQLNVDAPYLLKKMIGVDYVYFIQKNHLDLKNRVLEIEATNETFASRVSVVEKCRYYVHPENPDWTCFEQSALLDVKNFFGLENTVEKIAMKQYAANIAKGKELIEEFMKEVHTAGVKDLRPWDKSNPAKNRELRRVVSRNTEPLSPGPGAEPKRHSIPGTSRSGGWKSLVITKSSEKILGNRSKSAISIHEQNNNRSSPERIKSGTISPEPKKSELGNLNINKSKQKLDQTTSSTRVKSDMRVKSRVWHKKDSKKTEKKKVTLSSLDLNRKYDSDDSMQRNVPKSCNCDAQSSQMASLTHFITRWDSLALVLVGAMVLILVLSAPFSFLFVRRFER
ncbi:unnamed protein product [Euphydryas editha]|uniref:PRELI/MSF1 domain-containing protein n=1 Tax=Euphydryas editha TaxID=104508 RepID=A0AAU9U9W2_EUPED|nr:unnamed protein product [Euphydryas editha]